MQFYIVFAFVVFQIASYIIISTFLSFKFLNTDLLEPFLKDFLGTKAIREYYLLALLWGLIGFVVWVVIFFAATFVFSKIGITIFFKSLSGMALAIQGEGVNPIFRYLLLFIKLVILLPLGEEALYRGFIQMKFKEYFGKSAAIFLCSLFYAIIKNLEVFSISPDYGICAFLANFFVSMCFCIFVELELRIFPVYLAHAITNLALYFVITPFVGWFILYY